MRTLRLVAAVVISFGLVSGPARALPGIYATNSATSGSAAAELKQDMRKLWTDHVVWTRDYIIDAVGDQPDADAAAKVS